MIGRRVRQARERAGFTQAALAEAAGVTDETISRLERGAYEPALSTIVAVVEALGLDLDTVVRPRQARVDRAAEPGPPPSPVLRRLVARARVLAPEAQRVLLRLAELLPARAEGYPEPDEG